MRLSSVLQKPFYAGIATLSAILFFFVYVYTQVLGNLENVHVWIANLMTTNGILLLVFVGLFGVTMAYQLYLHHSPKICSVKKRTSGTGIHGIGTIGVFLIAQCPACASLGALFLPVSAVTFLAEHSVVLNVLSIGLLLVTLHYLGAFQTK